MRTPLATLTLTLALSLPGLASADVFQCPDGKGGQTLRQVPCSTPLSASEERAAALAEQLAKENARTLALAPKLTAIRQAARPSDYQQRVDAVLVRLLKEPASRQVTYTATPYGSLVCGTVNARNSFGGYTGAQPFVAYFDSQGGLGDFKVYPAKELKTALLIGEDLEQQLLRDCGYRSTP